jgi:uncharacterized membrane protein
MTLSHRTDVYETLKAQSIRNRSEYGVLLGLICVALALVVASVMFPDAYTGGEFIGQFP